jgi:hypothetical protein
VTTTKGMAEALAEVWREGKAFHGKGEIDWRVFAIEIQRKTEPSDGAIEQMATDLDDEPDTEDIVRAVQHLLWPPDFREFLHTEELDIWSREDRPSVEWTGTLACAGGCQRIWHVEKAASERNVREALTAAHRWYRFGETSRSVSGLFGMRGEGWEDVAVTDRRHLT